MTRKNHIVYFLFLLPVVAYPFSYICLSLVGKYEGIIDVMDKVIGAACLCASSEESWQPYKIQYARFGDSEYLNHLGLVYYPLVSMDQKYWHPNIEQQDRGWTAEELEEYKKIVFVKYLKKPENDLKKEKNNAENVVNHSSEITSKGSK